MSFQLNCLEYFYYVVFFCTFPNFKFHHMEAGYQSILRITDRCHNLCLKIFTFLKLICIITESNTKFLNFIEKTQQKIPQRYMMKLYFIFKNMLCEF